MLKNEIINMKFKSIHALNCVMTNVCIYLQYTRSSWKDSTLSISVKKCLKISMNFLMYHSLCLLSHNNIQSVSQNIFLSYVLIDILGSTDSVLCDGNAQGAIL